MTKKHSINIYAFLALSILSIFLKSRLYLAALCILTLTYPPLKKIALLLMGACFDILSFILTPFLNAALYRTRKKTYQKHANHLIIALHGVLRSPCDFNFHLKKYFQDKQVNIIMPKIQQGNTIQQDIATLKKKLKAHLQDFQSYQKISIIGHSRGAILAYQLHDFLHTKFPTTLFTIAAPFQGSKIAQLIQKQLKKNNLFSKSLDWLLSKLKLKIAIDELSSPMLNQIPKGKKQQTNIICSNDLIIGHQKNQSLKHTREITITGSHLAMMMHPSVRDKLHQVLSPK